MPTNTLNGRSFQVNEEGFLTERSEWSEELAADLAALIDLELTDAHWAALRFMRDDSAPTGVTPTLRRMQTVGGFDIKELYRLFPVKPAKKMSWLAGLPKPVGCV
ncbi:TusE/DsrC/DsvC family sulfur relay protein [Tessaracoccus flavus]|uniref:Sulfur relay protein DsrC n=1 Tax=Tessaracoccus flavus TaxID=1610493 RepID=A0A1Q2CIG7_9ACTN|nr:TusE/DsrC/DsvC family sulfur relay protein [Tessaracoccus flavus]AQP45928.1 sulfur relay protein DsrC [Tessaracoccus flavus]SDZ05475.1 tRNA 2-thiouridine synthesizing protein E [Tessaracoccus flavus]